MKTNQLPRRAFNSPLIEYANFENFTAHINLIRLSRPYASGISFAIHNTTKCGPAPHGLFKTYEAAKKNFEAMVQKASENHRLENKKIYFQNLSFNGFQWTGSDRGIHSFQKKTALGYQLIECSEDQLHNGDLEFMTEHGLSLGTERKRAYQKKFQASQKS